jgi:hypothetical protein
VLIFGFVFFGSGVSIPDRTGLSQRVWSVPEEEVGVNPAGYRWANYLIMVSAVLTVGGLGLLSIDLIEGGSLALASTAFLLFAIAVVFWLFFLAFRITEIIWATMQYHENGAVSRL